MTDRYSRQVARIAVAQMAETAGFDGVQESAVEVLADLMLRYVAQLASTSHAYAEVAGRTDCNVNDVVSSISEIGRIAVHLRRTRVSLYLLQLLAFEDMGISLDSLKAYAGTGVSSIRSVFARHCCLQCPAYRTLSEGLCSAGGGPFCSPAATIPSQQKAKPCANVPAEKRSETLAL